jgi:cytidylate kinase
MIVAVDGPAASGKGTLARALAAYYQLGYLDTGLLYRQTAKTATAQGIDPSDDKAVAAVARKLPLPDPTDVSLRTEAVGEIASRVAVLASVRAALLDLQRDFARFPPAPFNGVVLDGRDIGTQVLPNADVKLFLVADLDKRTERRWKELRERGVATTYEAVFEELRRRDDRDRHRAAAPLVAAHDAYWLDSTAMDQQTVLDVVVKIIELMADYKGKSLLPE